MNFDDFLSFMKFIRNIMTNNYFSVNKTKKVYVCGHFKSNIKENWEKLSWKVG